MVQSDTDGQLNRKIRESRLRSSLHMTAPFMFLVSSGFGLLYFVELGLHGLIVSGQPSYSHVLCLVVSQAKLVLGTQQSVLDLVQMTRDLSISSTAFLNFFEAIS